MPEIEIWTLANCPRCEEAKTALREAGFDFIERSLDALKKGAILDVDAMVHLVMQDGQAPLISIDSLFVNDAEFEIFLLGTD